MVPVFKLTKTTITITTMCTCIYIGQIQSCEIKHAGGLMLLEEVARRLLLGICGLEVIVIYCGVDVTFVA